MTIKEFITNYIKDCKNLIIKQVFENLLWEFEDNKATFHYNYSDSQKNKQDNIDGVCIYILMKKKGSQTYEYKNGYKSIINDDIIENNGNIYQKMGEYQSYNFYKFQDVYFFRMKGSNVLSMIDDNNYDKFKEFIGYIENGDKNEK